MTPQTASIAPAGREHAWAEIYDAEVALHIARQSGVDSWIAAAYEHLHVALEQERACALTA
jgi:hypothetical protein